jgi:hypothetical protein
MYSMLIIELQCGLRELTKHFIIYKYFITFIKNRKYEKSKKEINSQRASRAN